MRTLWMIFMISSLHLATETPLLAQSSQRADLLSFSGNTLAKSLPDTLSFVPSRSRSSESASSPTFKFYQKENTVLLYLRNHDNQVSLRVADSTGNTVQTAERKSLDGGFYEFILFEEPARSGLYTVCLVVNEQILTFQIFP